MAAASKDIRSIHDYIREYVTYYLPMVVKRSANTIKAYIAGFNSFRLYMKEQHGVQFIDLNSSHFSLENVNGWLKYLQEEKHNLAATLNLRLTSIKGFLCYCSDRSGEYTDLYKAVKQITQFEDKEVPDPTQIGYQYLEPKQLKLLFSIPDVSKEKGRRNRFFMMFAFETGARLSELLNLRLRDICDDQGQVTIYIVNGKGGKDRPVPLAKEVVPHLKAYLREFHENSTPDDHLFYVRHHGVKQRMEDSTPAAFVRECAKKAHEKDPSFPEGVHVHMFRHSLGTQLVRKDVPLSYIADLFGHAHLDTTRIYAKSDPKAVAEAVRNANEEINKKMGKPAQGKKWKGKEEDLLKLCGLKPRRD